MARQAGAAIVVAVILASAAVLVSWRTMSDGNRRVTAGQTSTEALHAQMRALDVRVAKLHRELRRIDGQLATLDPVVYGRLPSYDAPRSNFPGTSAPKPPPVPERGSVHELNLAFERIQILNKLEALGQQASALRTRAAQPELIPTVVSNRSAREVAQTPPATVPALVALSIAVVLISVGAIVLYRRRTRAPTT